METSKTSDEVLLLFSRGENEDAVKILYKKLFPVVKRNILQKGGGPDDAFDVFQDALVDVFYLLKKGQYDMKYNVFGLVYNMCLNKWFNKVKRDSKMYRTDEISKFEEGFMEGEGPSLLLSHEDDKLIDRFFAEIGDKCKELLRYTIIKDLSLEDVMLRMAFPSLAAVKMQHKRCKEKVVEKIRKKPALMEVLKGLR